MRRLNTNPGSYIGQPNYGAGLPQFIGKPANVRKLAALVQSQMLLEDSVAKKPAPIVTISQSANLSAISVNISYTDIPSNAPTVLAFTLN